MNRRILTAATLTGYLVRDRQGDDLGCIEELMVVAGSGIIAFAVLSLGGILGGRLLAVPWEALTLDLEQRVFMLDRSRDALEDAPAFDESEWPDFTDASWAGQVRSYFGLPPEFEAAA